VMKIDSELLNLGFLPANLQFTLSHREI
jgi:hypothetical protein